MQDQENPQQKAIRLLNRQLGELQTVRGLNAESPQFSAWYDTTRSVLDRFLGPESHYTKTFGSISFLDLRMTVIPFGGSGPPPGYVSQEDLRIFRERCGYADATLRAAIRHVEDFDVHVEEPKSAPARRGRRGNGGGVTQTFNAQTVTIQHQAIATDEAIQSIGQIGDQTIGDSLKEIAELLKQSEDITPRQLKEGLADIEAIAVEEQKPEPKRNWKVLLERGSAILELIGKAADLGHELAAHTPAIVALVEQAKHYIK